jgi:acetyl esterase/lipase
MRVVLVLAALLASDVLCAQAGFDDVLAQSSSPPAMEVQWGRHAAQRAELYLPRQAIDSPLIVLIHGGCWLSDFDMAYMRPMAEALSAQGRTVWSLSYRRLGHDVHPAREGLQDLLTAIGRLADWTPGDVDSRAPVWLVGHSAGGHLALLAAAELGPERVAGVVGLAAITDLADYAADKGSCNQAAARLLDGSEDDSRLSPIHRLPLGVPQVLAQGEQDTIVAARQAEQHVAAARAAGDSAELLLLESAGHFELVIVDSPAFGEWTQHLPPLPAID